MTLFINRCLGGQGETNRRNPTVAPCHFGTVRCTALRVVICGTAPRGVRHFIATITDIGAAGQCDWRSINPIFRRIPARCCAWRHVSASGVDLIGPAGFDISDRALRRAGLDYLDRVEIARHIVFRRFRGVRGRRLAGGSCCSRPPEAILTLIFVPRRRYVARRTGKRGRTRKCA